MGRVGEARGERRSEGDRDRALFSEVFDGGAEGGVGTHHGGVRGGGVLLEVGNLFGVELFDLGSHLCRVPCLGQWITEAIGGSLP